jgi:hypothetical protein
MFPFSHPDSLVFLHRPQDDAGRLYMPVPLSATICGLVAALSVKESDALLGPVAPGVKTIVTTHEPFGLTVA